jgi:hypothetical protein
VADDDLPGSSAVVVGGSSLVVVGFSSLVVCRWDQAVDGQRRVLAARLAFPPVRRSLSLPRKCAHLLERENVTNATFLLMTIAIGLAPSLSDAQVGGNGVLPIFIDYAEPPPDIHGLAAKADAIAVVRVEAIRFESIPEYVTRKPTDVTRYDVRVTDTLKSNERLPSTGVAFTLTRPGGQHLDGGRVIRSAVVGFEDFRIGAEYVLFLGWNKVTNDFFILHGPDGAYELISAGTVRPLGKYEISKAHLDEPRDEFLQDVRLAAAR